MACDRDTVIEEACASGIGKVTDPTTLWQIIAQSLCGQVGPVTASFRITESSDFRITQAGDSRIIQ